MKGHYGYSNTWNPSSMLVDGSSGNPDLGESYLKDSFHHQGTIYVVQGNSGASTGNPELNHPAFYANYGCDTCGGSTIIEVHGDTLRGQFLSMDGQILDRYQIIKASYSTVRDIKLPDYLHQQFNLLYPNPSTGDFSVSYSLKDPAGAVLKVVDVLGKTMLTQQLSSDFEVLHVNAQDWSSGVYFVVARNAQGQSISRKLVIE